jgi:hypothetical protein
MPRRSRQPGTGTLAGEPRAESVAFDADNMWVSLTDGRKIGIPLAYFPRLLRASLRQRQQYVISGGGTGLHWDRINEDISVRSLVMGIGDRTRQVEAPSYGKRKAAV